MKFNQVVVNDSSWVLRWSYNSDTMVFSWWTQEKPNVEYTHFCQWYQFQDFLDNAADGSWGRAINQVIKPLPQVSSLATIKSRLDVVELLPEDKRNAVLREVTGVLNRYNLTHLK